VVLATSPAGLSRALERARPEDEVCVASCDPGEVIARLMRAISRTQTGRRMSDVFERWRAALPPGSVAAVLSMDLDHFARTVARVGAKASDSLLEAVHARLETLRRGNDLIVRDRGDDFIALLSGESQEEITARASRLQASIAAEPFEVDGSKIDLTTSAGLVLVDRYAAAHTYRRAEMAMIMAKTSGRNDLVFFDTLEQANHDGLTGVYNRRYFDDRIRREVDLARQGDSPLSLALFDLDDFGSLNKRHGHPVGDAALIRFAAVARDQVGERGWVARYGGEEFCVVARQHPEEVALLAERVRSEVAALQIPTADSRVTGVTVSAGVVTWRQDDARSMVQRASILVRTAKGGGKNRVQGEATEQVGTG